MYSIFTRYDNSAWLIINNETKMETPWYASLTNACEAAYSDACSADAYYKKHGYTLLKTEVRPTTEYIQQYHPELLI